MDDDDVYSDEHRNPKPCDHSSEDSGNLPVCTYQITYTNIAGVSVTELVDATDVCLDGDLVELWDGHDLILGIQECAVQQIRNVSRLDMRLI